MTMTASVRSVRKGFRARTLIYVLASLGLVVTLAPFAWMILGSIKPTGEILADPNAWLPKNPTLGNLDRKSVV